MNLSHFLIAIRWQNVFITWLMQSVVYFKYIIPYCDHSDYSFLSFLLFIFVTGMILSGGNIYNDIQDIGTDSLQQNKPNIVGQEISVTSAWKWYIGLTVASIVSSVAGWLFYDWPVPLLLIIIFGIVLLYLYSVYLKGTILIGNLLIALLCALSVWMTIYLAPSCDINLGLSAEGRIPIILTGYIINAFSITILREVTKDKEDAPADLEAGIFTIGSTSGKVFKWTFIGILLLIISINVCWFYYLQPVMNDANWNLGVFIIFIPLLTITLIFNLSHKPLVYSFLSKLIKVYILFAIILLILWQRG